MQESEDEASLYPDIECLHQERDYLHDDEGEERGINNDEERNE